MTHPTTCTCSCRSPFRFREFPRPSIFGTDSAFCPVGKQGLSMSHIQSATTARITRETGRSPGTVHGLSAAADQKIAAHLHRTRKG